METDEEIEDLPGTKPFETPLQKFMSSKNKEGNKENFLALAQLEENLKKNQNFWVPDRPRIKDNTPT